MEKIKLSVKLEWLNEDQKEALRQVNKNKKIRNFYFDIVNRGWSEESALQDTFDELLFHSEKYGVDDLIIK